MTLEMCAATCSKYAYFGTEYGRECYCGNTLNTGTMQSAKDTDCSFPCAGNAKETCGSGSHLSLYFQQVAPPPAPAKIGTFAPQGCYTEATGARSLGGMMVGDPAMTNELCAGACRGFTFFGTEYGDECK
jgi:hypothetical protein